MEALARAACPSCAGRIEAGQRVCRACGTLRPEATATPEEESAALMEARHALHAALADAELQRQPPNPVRDRFLRHAPVPRHTVALMDEAVYCQSFFSDAFEAETGVPRERFRALLTRLELNAIDEPELGPKLAVLRGRLEQHERAAARNSRNLTLGILVGLGLLIGAVLLVLRAVAAFFG